MSKKNIKKSKISHNMGLTPREIVKELDRFIVGQSDAKKAVAVALRNRMRRRMVAEPMKTEIVPKNILMIGPTGVGKTEISRRLAKLAQAPFIKVEATKFTEVGYVGRDVESIIRDLVESAIASQKAHAKNAVQSSAHNKAIERVLDVVVGTNASIETRDKFRIKILEHEMDDIEIEIDMIEPPSPISGSSFEIPGMPGAAIGMLNVTEIFGKAFGQNKTKIKKVTIKEAIEAIIVEESDKLIDNESVISAALNLVQNDGIVFIDEIDKITSRSDANSKGGEVSREGVQRDLLPLIEGTSVSTKYGSVLTDHILFIASGAFHISKPSDLLPELQGRLPIRVELKPLVKEDLIKILTEPESSLIKQYTALMKTEQISLKFTDDAIEKLASYAVNFNAEMQDIGARRLHTIMEKLLEELSFEASDLEQKEVVINADFVNSKLDKVIKNMDLAKFIL